MATAHGRAFPAGSLDPYLEWAIENNFRHLRPGQWLPMLVEFRIKGRIARGQPTALQTFTQLGWLDAGLKKSVRVPEIFVQPPDAIAKSRYFNFCVLLIDKDQAAAVTTSAGWLNTISDMRFSPPLNLPPQPAVSTRGPSSNQKPGLSARIVTCIRQLFGRMANGRMTVSTAAHRQAGTLSLFGNDIHPAPRSAAASSTAGGMAAASPTSNVLLFRALSASHRQVPRGVHRRSPPPRVAASPSRFWMKASRSHMRAFNRPAVRALSTYGIRTPAPSAPLSNCSGMPCPAAN